MRAHPLLAVLLVGVTLAGCTGGDDPGTSLDTSGTPAGSTGDPGQPTATKEPAPKPPKDPDFAFHTHDMWGGRESYVLFSGSVSLGEENEAELEVRSDGARLGYVEFNPEADGDHDMANDQTDIVWQGTKEIRFSLEWDDDRITGLKFYFSHASTPEFILFSQDAIISGETYTIPLKPKWADMPHSNSVSRWDFRIEAYNEDASASPYAADVALGEVQVFMEIEKGDESYIDPPHPFFYGHGPVRDAGHINLTLANQAFYATAAENTQKIGPSMEGYRPLAPAIVAWETNLLRAWVYYNYTGPASSVDHEIGFMYHGADSIEWIEPDPIESGDGYDYYEITVDGTMTDSPYAFQTEWEYGFFPITNGQDRTGDFQGDIHLKLESVKR